MPLKQIGSIDSDLLAEVDERADRLGQTRRVFVERALRERLDRLPKTAVEDLPPPLPKE